MICKAVQANIESMYAGQMLMERLGLKWKA